MLSRFVYIIFFNSSISSFVVANDVAKHMEEGGYFISSGILVEKEELVAAHLREQGFEIVEIKEDGLWCAIVATI